jgi:hypothetical protein
MAQGAVLQLKFDWVEMLPFVVWARASGMPATTIVTARILRINTATA